MITIIFSYSFKSWVPPSQKLWQTGQKSVKEIPEEDGGRFYIIVVDNENNTGILLLIAFSRLFSFLFRNFT